MAKAQAKSGGKTGPKGPKAKPRTKGDAPGAKGAAAAEGPGKGHNKSRLTEDQERALFAEHRKVWNRQTGEQTALDEKWTKVKAALKSDGFKVLHMTIADDLAKPKGEKKQTEAVQDRLKVARWVGHPMGNQLDLFNQPDRTPSADRAFDEGKQASMDGAVKKPPYSPETEQYRSWMAGWEKDQERLRGTVGTGKPGEAGERVSRSEFHRRLQETGTEGTTTNPQSPPAGEGAAEPTAPGSDTKQ